MIFDKVQKRLESLGYKVYTNKVTGPKGDVVASLNPYGNLDTKDQVILKLINEPVEEVEKPAVTKSVKKRSTKKQ